MPDTTYLHPRPGRWGRFLTRWMTCRALLGLRRHLLSRLPFLVLRSDVRDVVYLNWLVDAEAMAHLVPPGVRLWQRDGQTLFTVLTYGHRHFGPALAGPLRRLFPSPLQSNWRLYVEGLPGGRPAASTVLFVRNVLDSTLYTFVTRLFSDALPSHLALRFEHRREGDRFETLITSGQGSAPGLRCDAKLAPLRTLPPAFAGLFPSWEAAVEHACVQHTAICPVAGTARIAQADIDLPIDLATVQPLDARVEPGGDGFLAGLVAGRPLWSFVVPATPFRVLGERLL